MLAGRCSRVKAQGKPAPLTPVNHVWHAALTSSRAVPGGILLQRSRPVPREITSIMSRQDVIQYCQREAARLRAVLPRTTTPAVKARLLEKIEEYERIARGEIEAPELELRALQAGAGNLSGNGPS